MKTNNCGNVTDKIIMYIFFFCYVTIIEKYLLINIYIYIYYTCLEYILKYIKMKYTYNQIIFAFII